MTATHHKPAATGAHDDHGHDHGHDHDHDHDVIVDHSVHTHVCSTRLFAGIFVALLFLTIVTVAVSQFDFGGANMLIAVLIASVKAALVMSVFMHLKWDTAINNIAFLSSVLFLSLLFLFTIADVTTRGEATVGQGTFLTPD